MPQRMKVSMPLSTIIHKKRKELGLTQEQVASYLGVSFSAVSKWESGSTCPDISLLPPLARLLNTDINTLLCFQEELSDQEMIAFQKEQTNVFQNKGAMAGFAMAMEKINENPNYMKFIYQTALVLEGLLRRPASAIQSERLCGTDYHTVRARRFRH